MQQIGDTKNLNLNFRRKKMKDLSRNSMKKDEKRCKGKQIKGFRTCSFIKNYFLEIFNLKIL
mgnify:CR=1 FL=1